MLKITLKIYWHTFEKKIILPRSKILSMGAHGYCDIWLIE